MNKIYILFLLIYFIGFIIQESFCDLIEGMNVLDEFEGEATKVGNVITSGVSDGYDDAKTGLKEAGGAVGNVVSDGYDGTKKGFKEAGGAVGNELSDVGDGVVNTFWRSVSVDVSNLDLNPERQNRYQYVTYTGGKAPEWEHWTGYDSTAAQHFDLTKDMIKTLEKMRKDLGITDIQVGPDRDEQIVFQYEVIFIANKKAAFYFHPANSYLDATDIKQRVYEAGHTQTFDYGSEHDPTIVRIEKSAPLSGFQLL